MPTSERILARLGRIIGFGADFCYRASTGIVSGKGCSKAERERHNMLIYNELQEMAAVS
jgi:hypothetical protein